MFEYKGIAIRPIEERDLEKMVLLRSDPDVWTNLGDITMINLKAQEEWFLKLSSDPKKRYYILATNEIDFLGIVRMDELDWINRSVRVGGDIVSDFRGKGHGKRLFQLLAKYSFDYLNLERIWLLVLEQNLRARTLYRNSGFVEEGRQRRAVFRDGKYHDYIMMSLLREEWLHPNPPPCPAE
jgi:RimJ/RimL family protein N-acetyltransferase